MAMMSRQLRICFAFCLKKVSRKTQVASSWLHGRAASSLATDPTQVCFTPVWPVDVSNSHHLVTQ